MQCLEKFFTGSDPDLLTLMRFPTKDGEIDIAVEVGASYTKFGVFLLDDRKGVRVSALERSYKQEVGEINRAILREWLQGVNGVAVTWDWLLKCLKQANLHALAQVIENGLTV